MVAAEVAEEGNRDGDRDGDRDGGGGIVGGGGSQGLVTVWGVKEGVWVIRGM